ncbi:MAG TPA: Mut7-C RNAse domain-containing protein [Nitrospirota bacterium]|nr:Mut7-C RNAse domain-containing protein [Nitrospirota bacterium]
MKFVADVMLGRLAKWMRLLGFDVLYDRAISDNEIIRISLEQARVILTRDTGLVARPLASNHVFINNDNVRQQLQQVLTTFHITSMPGPLTRCSVCNTLLLPVAKQDVRDLVPLYVYEKNNTFLRCESCRKIYWQGTHVKRMELKK